MPELLCSPSCCRQCRLCLEGQECSLETVRGKEREGGRERERERIKTITNINNLAVHIINYIYMYKKRFCCSSLEQAEPFFQASVIVALINSSKSAQVCTMTYALDSWLFSHWLSRAVSYPTSVCQNRVFIELDMSTQSSCGLCSKMCHCWCYRVSKCVPTSHYTVTHGMHDAALPKSTSLLAMNSIP